MPQLNLKGQISRRTATTDSRAASLAMKDIPIGDIAIKGNIRQTYAGIEELKTSIRQHGLIQPIQVYQENGGYIVKTGHRRFLAHQALYKELPNQFSTIRCVIADAKDIPVIQLIENVQREGLSDKDLSDTLSALKKEWLSNGDIAKIMGKSAHYIDNIFSAVNDTEKIPELKEFLQTPAGGSLQAIAETAGIEDASERVKLIGKKLNGEITREELRERKRALQKSRTPQAAGTPAGGSSGAISEQGAAETSKPAASIAVNSETMTIQIIFQGCDKETFEALSKKLRGFLEKQKSIAISGYAGAENV